MHAATGDRSVESAQMGLDPHLPRAVEYQWFTGPNPEGGIMKFKLAFAYGLLGLLVSLGFAGQVVVYSNDFEHAVGPEWSSQVRSSTPVGARQFLGEFSSGTVMLTLDELPPHTEVSVRFDLFILKSWDGQGPEGDPSGPDKWGFSVVDSEMDFVTTFSNHLPGDSAIYPEGKEQKYPNEWPDGENMPPCSGASEVDSLGYTYRGDSVYAMVFSLAHAADNITLHFTGDLTNEISNESWGLDNVTVSTDGEPIQEDLNVTITYVATGKPYVVSTALPNELIYIDRPFSGEPDGYRFLPDSTHRDPQYHLAATAPILYGAKFIRCANYDKGVGGIARYLEFTIDRSVTVYVAYDKRASDVADWLDDGTWTLTDDTVSWGTPGVAEGVAASCPMPVYAKDFEPGTITLGSNKYGSTVGVDTHYIPFIVPTKSNKPPTVDAGPDHAIEYPLDRAQLEGSVEDDGLPGTGLTVEWSVQGGPGDVTFMPSASVVDPLVVLTLPGEYVLRLTASDGELSAFDELTITYAYTNQVVYVDASATGANNGAAWTDAFTCLQDALMFAVPEQEIWVAEGVYTPDQSVHSDRPSLGRAETFELKNDVVVYGGFPAGGGAWDQRDPKMYPTILSGDLDSNDATAWPGNKDDNSYHVVTANRVKESAGLDGFIIVGGNANAGSSPHDCGGGMYIGWASPTIRNCLFKENNARKGGAIWAYYAGPIIEQCRFEDNSAVSRGGAVHSTVYAAHGSARIMGCEFKANAAGEYGGAVYCDKSRPHALNSLFYHNSAKKGAALYSHGTSEARLTNCTLSGNTASVEGGGAYDSPEATTTLVNCILWGNADAGSAVWAAQATGVEPDIYYCTIQGWLGADPLFVDAENGDYHLKSAAGRWDAALADWVTDDVTSPAIDAGSPFCSVGDEPQPHGERINQGAYGGTAEAGKSLGPFNIADLNRDGVVDIRDHAIMAANWLRGVATE